MVDVDVLWGFLFVFIVFGPIWFVIFKGSLGGRFSGFRMVELKCICCEWGVLCNVRTI